MRIQIMWLFMLFSLEGNASDKRVTELFMKYDLVMKHHKVDLIEEVFTKKFLRESGGKQELIDKIKELPQVKNKSFRPQNLIIKKGLQEEMFFVQINEENLKSSVQQHSGSQFIIVKEDDTLKIDGTLSDAE